MKNDNKYKRKRREFFLSIATDGKECSVVIQDINGISARQGKISIKGENKSMIKTKVIETTEKYDKDGKLIEKVIVERTNEDYEKGDPIISNGAIWRDKIPKPVPCCGMGDRTMNITY